MGTDSTHVIVCNQFIVCQHIRTILKLDVMIGENRSNEQKVKLSNVTIFEIFPLLNEENLHPLFVLTNVVPLQPNWANFTCPQDVGSSTRNS